MGGDEVFVIGRVAGVHGVKGSVKIFLYSELPADIRKDVYIRMRLPSGSLSELRIAGIRPYKKGILLDFQGVTNRDQAEALVGGELLLRKNDLPVPEEGTYYWFDLIGMSVLNEDSRLIGRLESIIETGSNDVYVILDNDGKETLIPALASVVLAVDVENKTMRVRLPDGL